MAFCGPVPLLPATNYSIYPEGCTLVRAGLTSFQSPNVPHTIWLTGVTRRVTYPLVKDGLGRLETLTEANHQIDTAMKYEVRCIIGIEYTVRLVLLIAKADTLLFHLFIIY